MLERFRKMLASFRFRQSLPVNSKRGKIDRKSIVDTNPFPGQSGPGLALAVNEREWRERLETRIDRAKAIIAETEMDSKIDYLRERAVALRDSGPISRK